MPRESVTHLFSPVATAFEAARLVRNKVQLMLPTLDTQEREFSFVTLCGACAIASYILHVVLRRLDVRNTIVMGVRLSTHDKQQLAPGEHCWVELDTPDLIMDVTATQHNIPNPVHVTSTDDSFYRERFRGRKAMNQMIHWGDQSPFRHVKATHKVIRDIISDLEREGYVRQRDEKSVSHAAMC